MSRAPKTPYEEPPKTNLGLAIRTARKEEKLTQSSFAKVVGKSRWTISMWELGEVVPSEEARKDLEHRFKVDLAKEIEKDQRAKKERFKVNLGAELELPTTNHRFQIGIIENTKEQK